MISVGAESSVSHMVSGLGLWLNMGNTFFSKDGIEGRGDER